ncbi:MAG: hypothetical protein GKR89_22315 [Candidatus Latescibacteria bacterium]|nr:hypothetical protein [Candidatus Latescibacterota bacterium]
MELIGTRPGPPGLDPDRAHAFNLLVERLHDEAFHGPRRRGLWELLTLCPLEVLEALHAQTAHMDPPTVERVALEALRLIGLDAEEVEAVRSQALDRTFDELVAA